jgi:hypothetical protein
MAAGKNVPKAWKMFIFSRESAMTELLPTK